jgi:ComF family protein
MRVALRYLGVVVEAALAFAAPARCAACDQSAPTADLFCASCRGLWSARSEPHLVDGILLRVASPYRSPLSDAIRRFKYSGRPDLARGLGALLEPSAAELGVGPGVLVVPVPLHPRRLAERGYNQAALLAAHVARRAGARYAPRALARQRFTTPQVGKARLDRATNVAEAFDARRPEGLRGARVVLVDDVVTTGATLSACAAALAASGADLRGAVALARASETGADG